MKFIKKIIRIFKMKKKIDKLFEIITKRVDFVNLTIKVKFFKASLLDIFSFDFK